MRRLGMILALLHVCCAARAESTLSDSRCYAGNGFGMGSGKLVIDGRAAPMERGITEFEWMAGCALSLGPRIGVLALGRLAIPMSAWSESRGESRTRGDLVLGPEWRWTMHAGRSYMAWHVAMPIGYSALWVHPGDGRAVHESFDHGRGITAGLLGGFVVGSRHHEFQMEAAYCYHYVGIDHSEKLAGTSAPVFRERYQYSDHILGGTIAYAYRF